jgi:hypothetical protein
VQDEITYLDDLYLEGDILDDISDIVGVREKAIFTGNYVLQFNYTLRKPIN